MHSVIYIDYFARLKIMGKKSPCLCTMPICSCLLIFQNVDVCCLSAYIYYFGYCAGYVHIGTCRISPDHRFLAYTVDTSGGELFSLEVKDFLSEHVIFSPPNKGIVSLAWAGSSESLFYTVCDETLRPNQ